MLMGFLAILSNNFWCLRMQRPFEAAFKRQDWKTVQDFMSEGIARSLRGALTARERAELGQVCIERPEVKTLLSAAFERGLNRHAALQLNLSNALDEVIRVVAIIVRAQRDTNAT
jgi:hypothetical protein